MKNRLAYIIALLLTMTPASALAMPWSWDMFLQPSCRAQKCPAPPTPPGLIPTTGDPFYAKDRAEAAKLKNPFPMTAESIERGRQRYNIFCATCHGDSGVGNGPVGQKYVTPADLTSAYVQSKPDGDIFYTITHGGLAVMPSYRDSVAQDDRWHIVNYIKGFFGRAAEKKPQGAASAPR